KRAYCLKIQPATGSFARNLIYSTKPITAFNLRPGEDTLYWIENGVFQTSVNRVVPYLDNFLSSE
ncbi:hypothetical protein RAF52_16560, partial [Klebsiella pneumoniae]